MNKSKAIKRDGKGLLSNVDYIYDDSGLIDWRKMIKTEFLVPNRDRTSETDVTKLKDYQLIILLGGIKELANIRGYTSVKYDVKTPSPDYVVATCTIEWTPNYETEGGAVTFSAIGDASPQNTSGFGQMFLAACAENRAFVRCVRNFLRINIVAQEELSGPNKGSFPSRNSESDLSEDQSGPHFLLTKVMKEKGISLDRIKTKLKEEKFKNVDDIESIEDIPKNKVFELIERIKKAK